MGSRSRRHEAERLDAKGAAASAINQQDIGSRDERVGRSLVATAYNHLEVLLPTFNRALCGMAADASNWGRTFVHSSVLEH